MNEVEKRLEFVLINTIEQWAKEGCATTEGVEALAAIAQGLVNLERG